MTEQKVISAKRKSRTKIKSILSIDYSCLSQQEIMQAVGEIQKRLTTHFRQHIGMEYSTSRVEIFQAVLGVDPYSLDIFKRMYWWNVVNNMMKEMRRKSQLFILRKGAHYFILHNEEEERMYHKVLDRKIQEMKNAKVRATEWVAKRKFASI